MSAGVGKTYRMLQEAQAFLRNGVDVKMGFVETHNRKETHDLLEGLPVLPRRKCFYKGKELDELDVQAGVHPPPERVVTALTGRSSSALPFFKHFPRRTAPRPSHHPEQTP